MFTHYHCKWAKLVGNVHHKWNVIYTSMMLSRSLIWAAFNWRNFDYTNTLVNNLLLKRVLDLVITKFEMTLEWIHMMRWLQYFMIKPTKGVIHEIYTPKHCDPSFSLYNCLFQRGKYLKKNMVQIFDRLVLICVYEF